MNLEFINALKNAASTVSVVTTNGKKGMAGATISSFCSVSANPASLLACVFKETPLSSTIKSNKKFCLNLLSLEQINISNIFAGREVSANQNKFDLVDWSLGEFNQPIITGSVASFECEVNNIIDGKTHNVFFGNVISIIDEPEIKEPLIYGKQKYAKYTNFDNKQVGLNKLMLEIL
jgi:flavin reductase (DIM6/NTAB) family NADH-FMN oxidoreductase RutF